MKNIFVIFGLLSLLSASAFADSLSGVAKTVHASSAGKLITVFGTGIYDANDNIVNIDGAIGIMTNTNALCDLSKQYSPATSANGFYGVLCFAK